MQRRSGRGNAVRREGGEETRLRILDFGGEGSVVTEFGSARRGRGGVGGGGGGGVVWAKRCEDTREYDD